MFFSNLFALIRPFTTPIYYRGTDVVIFTLSLWRYHSLSLHKYNCLLFIIIKGTYLYTYCFFVKIYFNGLNSFSCHFFVPKLLILFSMHFLFNCPVKTSDSDVYLFIWLSVKTCITGTIFLIEYFFPTYYYYWREQVETISTRPVNHISKLKLYFVEIIYNGIL